VRQTCLQVASPAFGRKDSTSRYGRTLLHCGISISLNHTARTRLDPPFKNCIFYISRMYEFSHSQGQSRRIDTAPAAAACPLRPNSGRFGLAWLGLARRVPSGPAGYPPAHSCRVAGITSPAGPFRRTSVGGYPDGTQIPYGSRWVPRVSIALWNFRSREGSCRARTRSLEFPVADLSPSA
jgi:hypothetical protein